MRDYKAWKEYHTSASNHIVAAKESFEPLLDKLSDTVAFNLAGGTVWVMLSTREDLAVVLQLAQKWDKSTSGKIMIYTAEVNGGGYSVRATDAAIPPTCKLVTKTEVIPEHTETVETLVCET